MSKQVDERVVSMQFDNKNFEKNVSTTMSTLDKLKQKLRFDGASKGLENINSATRKVDMNGLASGVEAVRLKFSALEVMGVTALANITNSAVNAGKRMVSALTIDPISDGFNEYEMTLNSIQTTMAGTGKSAKEVEAQLKTLDEYADKTVYSTADMLNNLPKFTNAGIELETATKAMIGIANATALAGGGASQAASAYYNLSQSIATGYLTRVDYNSISNVAGITTMEWKKAMVEAAIAQGTLTKVGEDSYQAGKKTFSLQSLFIDGLQEQWATTDVLMKVLGDYGDTETEVGKKAWAAAQDIKTYSQMMEGLRATAGTGWKETWQLIFGDLGEAKKLWTGIFNFISGILEKMSDARNKLLEGALGKRFTDLSKTISKITDPIKKVSATAKGTVKAVKDLGDIVDKVIIGKFGNGQERFDALTKAGYNYYNVQNKVNEKLGSSFRYTEDQIKAQDKLLGTQTKATMAQKEAAKTDSERIAKLAELSEAQLKNLGYDDDQIKAIKQVKEEADKLGISVDEFIKNIDNLNGRSLIIESFKNIFKGLGAALTSVKNAWQNVFPPKSMEEKQQGLYNIIAAFHKFSMAFKKISDEAGKEGSIVDKLRRTFEGLFTILKMVSTIIGGPIKIAFKIISKILGACNLDILDVTAAIGDAIVGFDKWISSTFDFTKAFENVATWVKNAAKAIGNWVDSLKESENLPKDIADGIMNGLGFIWNGITGFISRIGSSISNGFNGIPGNMISGFVNGIWNGIQVVGQVMAELGSQILSKFREVLGIHSPSTETQSDGQNFILGFVEGVKSFASQAWECIKGFASKCAELVGNINWGGIFAGGISIGLVLMVKKIGDALEILAAPFAGIGNILSSASKIMDKAAKPIQKILKNTAKVVKSFSKVLNGVAFDLKAEGVKKLAESVAILVGCIIALTLFDPDKLWESVKIVAALAGVLVLLAVVTEKMSKASASIGKNGVQVNNMSKSLVGIAASLLLVAAAVKLIGSMKPEQAAQGIFGLLGMIYGLALVLGAYGALVKGKAANNIDKAGKTILKIGAAMLLLSVVAKIIGSMKSNEFGKAVVMVYFFGLIIAGLIAATQLAGNKIKSTGDTILKVGAAMLLLAMVAKKMGSMKASQLAKGMIGVAFLAAIIADLIFATRLAGGNDLDKVGATILAVSGAMLLLSITAQIIGTMSWGAMAKAAVGITFLAGIIAGLIMATRLAGGNDLKGVAATLLLVSASIAVLSGVAVVLGMIPIGNLAKGIVAVGLLSIMMTSLIKATKKAKDCKGNLIVMTVAIGVMAAAVAALSCIEFEKLASATIAMSLLMGMFALIAKTAGSAQKSMSSLIVITGVVVVLAGVIYSLSELPIENAIGTAIALSTLMLAMSGVLFILSEIGDSANKALNAIIPLTALVIPLLAFVGVLAVASLVQNATKNAILLAALVTVLTVLLIPLTAIGVFVEAALLGVLALTAMAVPLIAFVGVLAVMQCIGDASKNVLLLTTLMAVLTDCLVKVALVAPLAVIGVAAIAALTVLMVAIGALAVAVGALMETFPQLEEFLDTGIPILEKLAYAVGSMVGNLIAGFSEALMDTLPKLGLCLSQFMINATPFIVGVKMVDQSVMDGVGILSLAVLALTAADLLAGVASFLQGGSSFADLGTELSQFIINATPFIIGAKALDPKAMEGVKLLAETILLLTATDILDGLTSWLTGGTSFADFGEQLAPFGAGIAQFAQSVSGLDESSLNAMNLAAKAGKTLAEMASSLPNSGGLMGKIFGENDMDTFGTQLEAFGKSLVKYGNSVVDLNVEAIDNSTPAAKSLSDLANNLPSSGGWIANIFGDNDMETFGTQLEAFGKSLVNYGNSVVGLNVDAIDKSVPAAKSLSDLAEKIPSSGGFWTMFGDNSLDTFGEKLEKFGESLSNYGVSVTGLDAQAIKDSVPGVEGLVKAAAAIPTSGGMSTIGSDSSIDTFGKKLESFGGYLASYANKVAGLDTVSIDKSASCTRSLVNIAGLITNQTGDKNLESFGKDIESLGGYMVSYGDKVKDLDTTALISAAQTFSSVANIVSDFSEENFSGVKSLGTSLSSIGSDAVDGFISAFTDAYDDATDAGSTLVTKLKNGANSQKLALVATLTSIMNSCESTIKSYYNTFFNAGYYLVEGFGNGISSNTFAATAKAKAMASAAAEAARKELDEHSPSKAGEGVAESAKKGLSNAISMVNNILNSDMDSQPTIRPVVDLDDVYSSVATMNSMLNLQPSVGVMSNVGSISRMMNQRNQNGGNDEVVSAINKLSKDLENVKGNTYNVNGITYDDGSNVSEAIGSLIRAARVERRR